MMSRIYLDSNLYIYSFEDDPFFGEAAQSIFLSLKKPQHRLFASPFTLGELLVLPMRENDEFTIARLNRFFRSPNVFLLAFSSQAAMIYAALRAHQRVKPLDALHLACAASAGMDLFVTNDLGLTGLSVPGIGAVVGMDASF